ncbi:DUF512 domain-containing protein [Hydrogenoanaerobacterium sp.]|uniref:DUF512 domain-containing protein n=1 Tax=Hydrogenoanaerobacterium sp. TaxID=2953763 RepID=UPI00289DAA2A|nr:DUF512 domain-containing protein [Hydrogenoanaerobacterium sp.]
MSVKIKSVEHRSPAQKAGIAAGETLHTINGNPIVDVLDYRFYMTDEKLDVEVEDIGGKRRHIAIAKQEYDDLGLDFETYLMDRQHTCKNKCVFCFVDQMPPNMRDTLYVKDDDSRMSFLFGNYITLTNLTGEDIDRIIKMRISPINVSVHSTNPELRITLMKNPAAATSLRYLKRLAEHDIKINTQLVLCPGVNDGKELERSITDLAQLFPAVESIACVPVGTTKFRDGLYPLRPYTKDEAGQVIDTIHRYSDGFLKEHGERIVYPADEFFLLAERPIPDEEYYGGFDQLENGVGLLAMLKQEFAEALADARESNKKRSVTIATGVAAGEFMKTLATQAQNKYNQLRCRVEIIRNVYFGENITVAGLITGTDLIAQLKGKDLGEEVLISSAMLRHEQDRFLDDLTIEQVEDALGVKLSVVDNDGYELLGSMLDEDLWADACE